MKTMYRVGDDFFIAVAFITFVVGIILHIMDVTVGIGINSQFVLFLSALCLLFSIALSLCDVNQRNK